MTRNLSEPDLFDRLRGNVEESQTAWRELRERLRTSPERYARPLATAVLASLETGADMPVRASILPALEACTREQPAALPPDLLDRLLQRAAELDTLSVLCLALLRVRADAEGLVTEGIQDVIAATEHALVANDDPAQRELQDYARDIAVELWETVADRDPAALVVVMEFWTAANGWDTPSSALFLELLLRVAPRRAEIRRALVDSLESVRDALAAGGEDVSPVERTLGDLRDMEERSRRRAMAESIASGLTPADDGADRHRGEGDVETIQPDAEAFRWKNDYLSEDPERSFAAREPLGPALESPRPAMVAAVLEAAEELFAEDPWDDRFGSLVYFLCRTAESQPELVPPQMLERWTRAETLEEWEQAMVFSALAQVDAGALVRHHLARALGSAVAAGGTYGSSILAGIGRVDPEVLLGFARGWLEREGWTEEVGPAIACAFEQVARTRPDLRTAMIELVRAHLPSSADDRLAEMSRCLERLARSPATEPA